MRRKKRPRLNHDPAFRKILAIAVIVFQLRVVTGTPKILSSWPRERSAFISRRYRPKTNRFFVPRIFKNHLPPEGRLRGVEDKGCPRFAKILTNQTIFGPAG